MELYNHRQTNRLTLFIGVIVAIFILVTAWTAPEFPSWLAVIMLSASLYLIGQVASLTVTVTDEAVKASFGSGLIRRTILLPRIKSVAVVRNSWYMGFGIRIVPGGWMFNVAGFDAVELTLNSGSKFRIGTDDPVTLEAAIKQAMASY